MWDDQDDISSLRSSSPIPFYLDGSPQEPIKGMISNAKRVNLTNVTPNVIANHTDTSQSPKNNDNNNNVRFAIPMKIPTMAQSTSRASSSLEIPIYMALPGTHTLKSPPAVPTSVSGLSRLSERDNIRDLSTTTTSHKAYTRGKSHPILGIEQRMKIRETFGPEPKISQAREVEQGQGRPSAPNGGTMQDESLTHPSSPNGGILDHKIQERDVKRSSQENDSESNVEGQEFQGNNKLDRSNSKLVKKPINIRYRSQGWELIDNPRRTPDTTVRVETVESFPKIISSEIDMESQAAVIVDADAPFSAYFSPSSSMKVDVDMEHIGREKERKLRKQSRERVRESRFEHNAVFVKSGYKIPEEENKGKRARKGSMDSMLDERNKKDRGRPPQSFERYKKNPLFPVIFRSKSLGHTGQVNRDGQRLGRNSLDHHPPLPSAYLISSPVPLKPVTPISPPSPNPHPIRSHPLAVPQIPSLSVMSSFHDLDSWRQNIPPSPPPFQPPTPPFVSSEIERSDRADVGHEVVSDVRFESKKNIISPSGEQSGVGDCGGDQERSRGVTDMQDGLAITRSVRFKDFKDTKEGGLRRGRAERGTLKKKRPDGMRLRSLSTDQISERRRLLPDTMGLVSIGADEYNRTEDGVGGWLKRFTSLRR